MTYKKWTIKNAKLSEYAKEQRDLENKTINEAIALYMRADVKSTTYKEDQLDALRYMGQDWPARDDIPTADPIGDVVEEKKTKAQMMCDFMDEPTNIYKHDTFDKYWKSKVQPTVKRNGVGSYTIIGTPKLESGRYKVSGEGHIIALPEGVTVNEEALKQKDEWVEGFDRWKKDNDSYLAAMKDKLIVPEGKYDVKIQDGRGYGSTPTPIRKFSNTVEAKPGDRIVFKSSTQKFINIDLDVSKIGKPYEPLTKKCDCGTHAVYGEVPAEAHSPICSLRRK